MKERGPDHGEGQVVGRGQALGWGRPATDGSSHTAGR